jgi:hypothetical protein
MVTTAIAMKCQSLVDWSRAVAYSHHVASSSAAAETAALHAPITARPAKR